MTKQISNFNQLIKSQRFNKATNNKEFSQDDLVQIELLYQHITKNGMRITNGYYTTFCQLVTHDLSNLIQRFEFLRKNSTRRTKETFLARYGDIVGQKKWQEYCDKQRVKNLYETKKEKYGWSLDDFKKFNKSRSVTEERCIARHGKEKGLKIWNKYIDRQRYTNSIEYFIEKYGNDGYQKWLEYNHEKAKASNLEWIMSKYSVNIEEALQILSKRNQRAYTSKAEVTFVECIEESISSVIPYSIKTYQFCIWSDDLQSPCFYDLADSEKMKIIEFNGDYWHCNPLIYDAGFYHPHSRKTAADIWKHDYIKIKAAITRGFSVKIVWESDFIKNKDLVIQECVRWWTT